MSKTDPRIDAYIDKAQPFAQDILRHLRGLVHQAVPDTEEAIKWGMPHFTINGKNLAGMAAFKAHASFGIWPTLEEDAPAKEREGMGSFGKLTSIADLPTEAQIIEQLRHRLDMLALHKFRLRKQIADTIHIKFVTDRRQTQVMR